jgi:hypothetical protein
MVIGAVQDRLGDHYDGITSKVGRVCAQKICAAKSRPNRRSRAHEFIYKCSKCVVASTPAWQAAVHIASGAREYGNFRGHGTMIVHG